MKAEQMWECYSTQNNIQAGYEAWAYGDAPDKLAKLTLDGAKTATASAYPLYAQEQEPIPEPGQYSVILDSREEAVCILQTTKVYVTPFSRVSEEQAWKEGEGDRSLRYWRKVHREFFTKELEEAGMSFTEEMDVVCEEFVRVYP